MTNIVLHCDLRSVSRQSSLALFARPIIHQPTEFHQNLEIDIWILTNFPGPFFRGRGRGDFVAHNSQSWENRIISYLEVNHLRFQPVLNFSCGLITITQKRLQSQIEAKFRTFTPENYSRDGRNLSMEFSTRIQVQTSNVLMAEVGSANRAISCLVIKPAALYRTFID